MIHVEVIGAGHWGPNLIDNFHTHQRSNVACAVDRDQARLEQVQTRFSDVSVATDAGVALGARTRSR